MAKEETLAYPRSSLYSASLTATANGSSVDTLGFQGVYCFLGYGAVGGTSPSFTFKVQDSDDGSAFTDVAAGDLLGGTGRVGGQFAAVTTGSGAAYQWRNYVGSKRYVRISCTAVGGTSPTLASVHGAILLNRALHEPAE